MYRHLDVMQRRLLLFYIVVLHFFMFQGIIFLDFSCLLHTRLHHPRGHRHRRRDGANHPTKRWYEKNHLRKAVAERSPETKPS
ncbi:hypothetical protein NDU88_005831 [Pleurodeles waltl]|uniref:Secreted protein n=1 Tax=Pleurodeles waltl TaxID=8319 RepID=A0AAV7L5M6_PLEWA|nr:hypothetical protein NDU88_005831 [Pleurodeles waltl]